MALGRSIPALLLLLFCGVEVLAAAEPRVTRLVVAVEGPYIRVTFDLEGAFTEDLFTHIESGVPSGFAYEIHLHRDRKRLWDAKVAEATLLVTASYDPVARTFLVRYELDGRLVDSRAAKTRAELERAMTRISSLPVFETRGLTNESRHIVSVRAEATNGVFLGLFRQAARTEWIESRKFRTPPTSR